MDVALWTLLGVLGKLNVQTQSTYCAQALTVLVDHFHTLTYALER